MHLEAGGAVGAGVQVGSVSVLLGARPEQAGPAASSGPRARVRERVPLEGGGVAEVLGADVAAVGARVGVRGRVRLAVAQQVGGAGEGLGAEGAAEQLLPRVAAHVRPQQGAARERAPAVGAAVGQRGAGPVTGQLGRGRGDGLVGGGVGGGRGESEGDQRNSRMAFWELHCDVTAGSSSRIFYLGRVKTRDTEHHHHHHHHHQSMR